MQRRPFGTLPSGDLVEAFTLTNPRGASVQILTYGGIVQSLLVPDRHGNLGDVVLGFDSFQPYVTNVAYLGAITGRIAGRLSDGRLTLAGQTIALPINQPPHHLHGGWRGLDKRCWHPTPGNASDGSESLRLSYRSPDGEEGYPGAVEITVTYTLTADHALRLDTTAVADRVTPLCLTHHSYFNLGGEGTGSIFDHVVQFPSRRFAPANERMIVSLEPRSLDGNAADFRHPRRLGEALTGLHHEHGDLYAVDHGAAGTLALAARVTEPTYGRVLEVSTDESWLQFYAGKGLPRLAGKSGHTYEAYSGLCLECQGHPGSADRPDLGNILLRPGELQRHTTLYSFSTD